MTLVRIILLAVALSIFGGSVWADEDTVKISLAAAAFDTLKDVKITAPEAVKFDGTLPLTGSNGKPVAGRVAGDAVLISLGQFGGQKSIKAGEIWSIDAAYPGNVTERYSFKLEKGGDGGLLVRSAQARQGAWNGKQIVLIDMNSNGRYDDAGVDQLIFDKTTVLKIGEELVLGKDKWSAKITPSGNLLVLGKGMDFSAAMQVADGGPEGALEVWNTVRRALKMHPLTRDPELERIGALHVKYMMKHGLGHGEDKGAPEYTADGHRAGMSSVLSAGQSCARDAILSLLDTFYHRIQMLQPDLATTGINFEGGFGGANTLAGAKRKADFSEPFAYPPDGAALVRPGWSGHEGPSPIPEAPQGGVGQTVTLTFPGGQRLKGGVITLKEGSASGTAVDAWTSAPDKPAPGGAGMFGDNMNSMCLIAKAPLKPETRYFAEVTGDLNGKPFTHTWSFKTGQGGFGRRRASR